MVVATACCMVVATEYSMVFVTEYCMVFVTEYCMVVVIYYKVNQPVALVFNNVVLMTAYERVMNHRTRDATIQPCTYYYDIHSIPYVSSIKQGPLVLFL